GQICDSGRGGPERGGAGGEKRRGRTPARVPARAPPPPPPFHRTAHLGVHAQKQPERNWIGVVLPVGKMTADQMRGLARVARNLGDGDIRLTVWQNLIISGVHSENVKAAQTGIEALGLSTSTNSVRAGLVACTGNVA